MDTVYQGIGLSVSHVPDVEQFTFEGCSKDFILCYFGLTYSLSCFQVARFTHALLLAREIASFSGWRAKNPSQAALRSYSVLESSKKSSQMSTVASRGASLAAEARLSHRVAGLRVVWRASLSVSAERWQGSMMVRALLAP